MNISALFNKNKSEVYTLQSKKNEFRTVEDKLYEYL